MMDLNINEDISDEGRVQAVYPASINNSAPGHLGLGDEVKDVLVIFFIKTVSDR